MEELANFKLTISDKKGKSLTKELKDNDANPLVGLNIGNEVDAAIVGQSGKMKITGGSDKSGVPMRADIHGGSRKYVLLSKGVGLNTAEKGQRVRKLVRGTTISEEVYQINCKFDGEIKVDAPPAEESKDEAAKDAPKKDEPKKDAPKKDEPKKDAPKKDEPKKDEPKKDAPKKDAPKKA